MNIKVAALKVSEMSINTVVSKMHSNEEFYIITFPTLGMRQSQTSTFKLSFVCDFQKNVFRLQNSIFMIFHDNLKRRLSKMVRPTLPPTRCESYVRQCPGTLSALMISALIITSETIESTLQ